MSQVGKVVRATALGLAALMLAAVAAFAAEHSSSESVAGGSKNTATASCTHGDRSVGVGFQTEITAPIGTGAIVLASSLQNTGHGGRLTATNTDPDHAGAMKAVVYCSSKAKAFKTRTKTAAVPNASTGTATATCPRGTTVVGGGFKVSRPATATLPLDLLKEMSRPTPRTLKVTGLRLALTSGGTPGHVTSIAYCSSGPAAIAFSATKNVPEGQSATVTARCPGGHHVLFGGERTQIQSVPGGPGAAATGLLRRGGNRVVLNAFNSGGSDALATAIAYCR